MSERKREEERRDTSAEAKDPDRLAREVEELRAERDRLEEQLKRTMADLANVRRRHVKEMEEARQHALEGFAAELLPVLDNFHLALDAHEQHESGESRAETRAMVEGLEMVRTLLQAALERHGLSEIPALGERFDPNVHEAVGVDTEATTEPGRVTRVMQRGYSFKDKVIRPSKVVVAGEAADDAGSSEGVETDEQNTGKNES